MNDSELWKYNSTEESKELLLSLGLLDERQWPQDKQLACLYALSKQTARHYYRRTIPKAGGGSRKLLVPDALLKSIQRNILKRCLEPLAVSRYAMAYRPGLGIQHNGAAHVGQAQVLNLDILHFFDSIDFAQVYRWAFPAIYYPKEVRGLLTSLCTYHGRLPQGAPTSPAISNLVLQDFDEVVGRWCAQREITYTRYCDDLTFSGELESGAVIQLVSQQLYHRGMKLNKRKTRLASRHERQLVTGVVVNRKVHARREYRRQLRQELYYCRKWGLAEHLRYIGDTVYLPLGEAGLKRYAQVLLGKVNFVLQLSLEEQAFRQAAQWLKAFIQAASPARENQAVSGED